MNVHLRRRSVLAGFQDCESARAARHLDELTEQVRAGQRAVMLIVVQRTGCARMPLARDLGPARGRAIDAAVQARVAVQVAITAILPLGAKLPGPISAEEPVLARPRWRNGADLAI
jgi:sugar fermentation stimulation protein A